MANSISFDLEHWHQATLLRDEIDDPRDRIEDSVAVVLDLLERYDVRATFFVLGEIARGYPKLVRTIVERGHEIGSHGYSHTPLSNLTRGEFETEVRHSERAIERVVGSEPIGFRAPNFSIHRGTEWAFDVLESHGYRYDSSVFPTKTPMYGVQGCSIRPYTVRRSDPFPIEGAELSSDGLIELPLSTVDWGVRVPVAGGFYSRVLPSWITERAISSLNDRGISANLYYHPWEFNPDVRVDDVPLHKRFVSFAGIETLERKVERLLSRFEFGPIRESLEAQLSRIEPDAETRLDTKRTYS